MWFCFGSSKCTVDKESSGRIVVEEKFRKSLTADEFIYNGYGEKQWVQKL